MKQQIRMDRMSFGSPQRLPNGYLRVPITATRAGIFVYRRDDGSEWREYRPAEEVFKPSSMETLKGVPATNGHPEVNDGILNADNTADHMVGFTSEKVERVDDLLATFMTITHAPSIQEVETGDKREVSCGYLCDLEMKPGSYQGQRYDAIQRNIRYNHVAICKTARGGSQVRIHLDSKDQVLRLDSILSPDETPRGDSLMEKTIVIDGVEYKVSADVHAAVTGKFNKDHQTIQGLSDKLKLADDDKAKVQARADSLETDLKKAKEGAGIRTDSAEFKEAIKARVALERFAEPRLDEKLDLSTLSDRDIIVELIKLDSPDFKAEGKSDVYLQSRLDHMIETADDEVEDEIHLDSEDEESEEVNGQGGGRTRRSGAYEGVRAGVRSGARNDAKGRQKSADEIRSDAMEAAANAWKKPIGKTRKA
jgi:hypothetical protein